MFTLRNPGFLFCWIIKHNHSVGSRANLPTHVQIFENVRICEDLKNFFLFLLMKKQKQNESILYERV